MRTVLAALLLCLVVAAPAWSQAAAPLTPGRALVPTVSATGNAEVRVRPDVAVVTLGVTTQAENLSDAITQNNRTMTAVVAAIKRAGLADRDIQTANLSVYPLYRNRPSPTGEGEQELIGYRVSNTVTARMTDMAKVGPVIDAATAAGANQVQGISFSLQEDASVRMQALADAAKEAQAKARAMAEALDQRLGPILSINEQGAEVRPMYAEAGVMLARAAPGVPVSPGEVTVTATVSVTYRLGS